jgi:hypothetical protein
MVKEHYAFNWVFRSRREVEKARNHSRRCGIKRNVLTGESHTHPFPQLKSIWKHPCIEQQLLTCEPGL